MIVYVAKPYIYAWQWHNEDKKAGKIYFGEPLTVIAEAEGGFLEIQEPARYDPVIEPGLRWFVHNEASGDVVKENPAYVEPPTTPPPAGDRTALEDAIVTLRQNGIKSITLG